MPDGQLGVNFCIINCQGEILLQQRDENCPYYPLQWAIPGGSQETGELLLDTAIREIKEEFELTVRPEACVELRDRPWVNNPGKIYIVKAPIDQTPIKHEGKAMQWVPLSKLRDRDLGFHHGDIVSEIQEYYTSHLEWFGEPVVEVRKELKFQ